MKAHERKTRRNISDEKPFLNFRPLVFCALGLVFGIFLYGKITFGGIAPSDFLFLGMILIFALFPLSLRRTAALLACVLLSMGIGALGLGLYDSEYHDRVEPGSYRFSGTVLSVAEKDGYSVLLMGDLTFNGVDVDGKCRLYLSGEGVFPADELLMTANVEVVELEGMGGDGYLGSLFAKDIRYQARADSYERTGRAWNPFLRCNGVLYRTLFQSLDRDEAGVAYALLTGNSGSMDEGLLEAAREGGIVHIFAVSGLHIGIVFGAVCFLFRHLKRWKYLPAVLFAFCYSMFCNFTVSSVRAVVMCGALSATKAFGKKYDFLNSIAFAAIGILLFSPAQWFSAGFRLTFGACLGLALFSGSLNRLFARVRLPKTIAGYLAASLSVQLFILPVQLESFGYFSALGTLFNLILIPILPIVFLETLLGAISALVIPPASGVLLGIFKGPLSLFLYLFSFVDDLPVLTGFSLGAASVVWLLGCLFLSERFRLSGRGKAILASCFACVFSFLAVVGNVVFSGCRIDFYSREGETVALIRTSDARALVIDGDISLSSCEDFLSRTYAGEIDVVVILSSDRMAAVNTAAFLGAKSLRLRSETETGLSAMEIHFGENFSCGALQFSYKTESKLMLVAENSVIEFDFEGGSALGADLFLGDSSGRLKYFLKDGIISAI